jgi:hypothetical protein
MTAMRMGSSSDSLMNAAFVRQPGGAQQPLNVPGIGQPSNTPSAQYIQQRARQVPNGMNMTHQPALQTVIHNQPSSISPRVAGVAAPASMPAHSHSEKAPVHSLTVQVSSSAVVGHR